ncbi:MAG: HAD family phosphatase [Chloroflexi bacterium]|nr:HAD family phosphatase [Chloroflexota bacterium]MBU1750057.1 HAD family phosphatase [Chloroflexota bacterium]MBU1879142.1 HAD family phosphatase [Chloroflexota bacterium]
MRESRAFILDMDGTIVDNIPFHLQSWLALLTELGVSISEDEFMRRMIGKTNAETLHEMVDPAMPAGQLAEYAERKEALYRELFRPHLRLVPGLDEFLRAARDLGVPMAVATSAPPPNISFVLEGLDIAGYFQAVIGADRVPRGKPHPDMFLAAAEALSAAPARCLVFEDALMGLEAARRAGMPSVAVATTLDARELADVPGVVQVIGDFTGLSPAAALAWLDSPVKV